MRVFYCLCYAAGLGVVSFVLGRLVPKEWFDYTRFPYRSFAFEKGGKIYEAIGIAKWQSRSSRSSCPPRGSRPGRTSRRCSS